MIFTLDSVLISNSFNNESRAKLYEHLLPMRTESYLWGFFYLFFGFSLLLSLLHLCFNIPLNRHAIACLVRYGSFLHTMVFSPKLQNVFVITWGIISEMQSSWDDSNMHFESCVHTDRSLHKVFCRFSVFLLYGVWLLVQLALGVNDYSQVSREHRNQRGALMGLQQLRGALPLGTTQGQRAQGPTSRSWREREVCLHTVVLQEVCPYVKNSTCRHGVVFS